MIACRAAQFAVILVCGTAALHAQPLDAPRSPDWSWATPAGIEWAALAGRGKAETIVVATGDARLQLLDPSTGNARLSAALETAHGARLVPAGEHGAHESSGAVGPADVVYGFDRHAVYAIRLSDPPGLKWQYGRPPARGEEFPGDPETLTGWTLAQVADAGVLLVNSDGLVVLLSHTDGRVRWQTQFEPFHVGRLHMHGDTAALLWRAEGKVKAAFVHLDEVRPVPVDCDVGDRWPVWSTLLSVGLLTVSPGEAVLYPQQGPPRRLVLPPVELRTLAVAAFEPAATAADADALRPGTLLLVANGDRAAAYDLSTSARIWPRREHKALNTDVCALRVCGTRVIHFSQSGATVYDIATGAHLAAGGVPALLDCHLADTSFYTLTRVTWLPQVPLVLTRQELASPGERTSIAASGAYADLVMQAVGEIRQVVWTNREVVLVRPNELRAYTLP